MTDTPPPNDPLAYQEWVKKLEQNSTNYSLSSSTWTQNPSYLCCVDVKCRIMQILTEIFRNPNLDIHGKTDYRTAVRAVVFREKKLLMIYSPVNGDYKFPGGGVEKGENPEIALRREVAEECGMNLTRILEGIGCIVEYMIPMKTKFDVFKMTSGYYLCEIDSMVEAQHLDDYEEELGFQPVWVDIDTAIQTNKAILQAETKRPPQWTTREIFMLEYVRKNLL